MRNNMKRMLCLLLAAITLAVLGTISVFAAEPPDGANSSESSSVVNSNEYASLTDAIAAAKEGDTVIVSAGTYDGFMIYRSNVTVVAEGDVNVTGMIFIAGNNVTLDGFTVNNPYGGAALEISGSTTVKDSTLSGDLAVRANSANATVVLENTNVNGRMDLAHLKATIKAVEGLNVTASVGFGIADYIDGVYRVRWHVEEILPSVAPTFTSTGLTEGVKCSVCGEVLVAQEIIAKLIPVAQIGNELYSSLANAIAAAQNGDTIKLIADITLTESDLTILGTNRVAVLVSGKSITLDLNGKNLTVNTEGVADGNVGIAVDADAELVFMDSGNGSFTVIGENAYYAFRNDGKLTIESGNVSFTGYSGGAIFFSTNGNTLVKGGNFTQTTEGWMANTSGKGDFVVTFVGGTYNRYFIGGAEYNENIHNEAVLGDGLKLNDNGDGTWTVISAGRELYVGDGYYDTLEEALAVAKNGDKIVLLKDLSITATDANVLYESTYGYSTLFLIEGKQIALDFNGYTVSVTPEFSSTLISVFFVGKGASLSMQDSVGNGGLHVNSGTDLYCAFYNSNSTIVIENGNYYVEKVVVSGSLVYADKQNDTTVENGNFTLGNAGTDSSSKPWIFNIHGKNEGNFIKINGGTYNQDLLMNYDTKRDCEVVLSDDCYLKELAGLYTVTKNDEE